MTDLQWIKQHITNPSEDELYFFVERVGIICDGTFWPEQVIEKARQQALKELKHMTFKMC